MVITASAVTALLWSPAAVLWFAWHAPTPTPTSELSSCALLVVPQLYLLNDEGARNVTRYGSNGGTVFVSAFTDVVDEDDAFRPGGFLVGLRELLGVTVEEFGALVPPGADDPGQAHSTVGAPFGRVRGEFFAEELRILDAEVVGIFDDGRLDGRPALTRKDHGAGAAYYLATVPDDDGMRVVLAWLLESSGVEPELQGLPPVVEVARRGDVLTVINHGPESQHITVDCTDVRTGLQVGEVELEPYGWRMVRR
ncbi:beta-galactosidase trimerization domain-containing protein [Plantibacter cousiniae (nom. nud.)]|uniref:beta-galactosidase trimerization domain-containing protein n=1 Tax=Plantibacter cousiniae (nom. nud.) TaxID=199709 RepID=UPI001DFABEA6|nr:beta-galactosidase trimerization domain-containing protein [Plantibacter cousiniae]CAH0242843.1 Beta-galactosidase [Plantibacter cousiniae]